jgi:hypothetical protein
MPSAPASRPQLALIVGTALALGVSFLALYLVIRRDARREARRAHRVRSSPMSCSGAGERRPPTSVNATCNRRPRRSR